MSYQIKPSLPQIHILADFIEIDSNTLRDAVLLQEAFSIALKSFGFSIIAVFD
jgi:hypothetical protein